nr:uncharacterized protein LOC109157428 [Ipomoea trifida]
MGHVAEVWLRDTDEGHARVVRECEAAFYLGQRDMQDQLYGKLRRRFTSFSIAGWKLREYLPLRRPPAPVMPTSTTTPADGFLMSPERAGGTSSVALPSDPVGGFGAVGSVDPSVSLHFTYGFGFSGSAAGGSAALGWLPCAARSPYPLPSGRVGCSSARTETNTSSPPPFLPGAGPPGYSVGGTTIVQGTNSEIWPDLRN